MPGSLTVEVRDGNVEGALKRLKKDCLTSGLFKEMKRRAYYEKPSVKLKRKKAEASKRRRKSERQRAGYDRRFGDE